MTDVAAGMVRPFGQKDRLDAAFKKFVVKFRRSSRVYTENSNTGVAVVKSAKDGV